MFLQMRNKHVHYSCSYTIKIMFIPMHTYKISASIYIYIYPISFRHNILHVYIVAIKRNTILAIIATQNEPAHMK